MNRLSRWLFFLAVPYVASVSTQTGRIYVSSTEEGLPISSQSFYKVEYAEDLAQALNSARDYREARKIYDLTVTTISYQGREFIDKENCWNGKDAGMGKP